MKVVNIKNFNICKIAESGQIFRFYKNDKSVENMHIYDLYMLDKHLVIKTKDFFNYEFLCSEDEYEKIYRKYFDLDFDYSIIDKIIKKDDKYLKKSIEYGRGIRILNQNPYEMLISFIISQRKSIKAIRTSIERLCLLCGNKINDNYGFYCAFPKPEEILKNKNKLSECGLGYRVPYIINACEQIIDGKIVFDDYKNISCEYFMQIKGVGIKVASCVMLFAYHKLDCVPVDVWMNRVLNNHYNGCLPNEYKKYAGIIQQYFFNYAKDEIVE